MEGKKKFVVAIILFVFMGLMVFTFANPSEDDTDIKLDSDTKTTDRDSKDEETNSDDEATIDNDNTNDGDVLAEAEDGNGNTSRTNASRVTNVNVNNGSSSNNGGSSNSGNTTTDPEEDNSYDLALEAVEKAEQELTTDAYDDALELVDKVTDNNLKNQLNDRLDVVKDAIDVRQLVQTLQQKVDDSENLTQLNDARDYRQDNDIINKVASLSNATLKDELETTLATLATILDDNEAAKINIDDGAVLKQAVISIEDENNYVATLQKEGSEAITIDNNYEVTEDGVYELTVVDAAYNSITITFTVDSTAAELTSLAIINNTKGETQYIKNGENIRILARFNEELNVEDGSFVVKMGDKTAKFSRSQGSGYEYIAQFDIAQANLEDGLVTFTLTGYTDLAGNTGEDILSNNVDEKILNSKYPKLILDNTIPVLNFNNGFITSNYTVEASDDNFDYMTVQYYDGREMQTIEDTTFTLDNEGDNVRYNIKVYDKAGNVSEYRDIYLDNVNPVIDGSAISNKKDVSLENNGTYQEVTLNISDGSLKKVILVKDDNKEEVLQEFEDNYTNKKVTFEKTYTDEGTYTIKAIDRNNNESTITFTIDKTPATRVYSTLDFDKSGKQYYEIDKEKVYYVKNGDSFVFRMQFSEELKTAPTVKVGGMEVPMTLNEKFLNNEGKYIYEGTVNITEEAKLSQGRLEIVLSNVVDMAGNESTDEVVLNQTPTSNSRVAVYDKTVPSATKVQIINNSNPNSEYIKNGETVRVRVTFSEKLATAPVLTIGNYTATFENVGDGKGNDLYSADITIKEDESELKEGKVAFTITGYTDLAGNPGNKVTEASVETNITYDRTAPVYRSLGIYGGEQHNNAWYVTNGDKVYINVHFNEKLAVSPYVKVNGKDVFQYGNPVEKETDDGEKYYIYSKVYKVNETDGKLSFEIYGYADAAGNIGKTLTATDTKIGAQNGNIIVDNTIPVLNFNNGFITSGYTVEATDDNFAYMTVQYYDGRGTEIIESNTFTLDKEGDNVRYKIRAYDKAGNVSSDNCSIYLDNVAPSISNSIAINGGKEVSVENNGTYQEVTLNISDGSLKKVSLVKEDGTEEVLETYKDNFKNTKLTFEKKYAEEGTYTIKAVDRNNNESTITFTIDNTPAKVKAANILVDGDVNEQQYFYAKIGDTIYSYVRFSEKLKELPTFTLINDGNEYKAEEVIATGPNDAGEYTYSIRYTINKDTKMSDGEITMLVTNIKDLAGNKTDDVVKPTNSHIVYLDTTAPVFKDAEQTMESDVTINVKEDNLDRIEVTNKTTGETYQVENGHKLTQEGFYKIIPYDKAGNQSNVWNLTIDDEAPVITIENATSNNYYNHDVVVNISDIELQQTYLDGEKQGRVTTLTVKGDGTHTVSAVDRYGHKSEITFTIDTIPVALVELRVNSSNANNTVAKVGDYFGIYLNVNEELKEDPTFTVNGKEYKVNQPDGRKVGDNLYQYAVVYEVTDDMEEGEIQFTISNIYDKAGNPLNDLSNNDANGKVIIDKTAPTATITYNTVDPTNHSVVATLTASEEVKILNAGTWNPEDGYGLVFKKSYPENNIQTVTIEDKAGNQNTVEVKINNIDKELPSIGDLESNETYTGVIPYEMSDNSGAFTLYYDLGHDYQSCEQLIANGSTMGRITGTYKGEYPVPGNYDGVSVCLVDDAGNKTFRNNISIRVN